MAPGHIWRLSALFLPRGCDVFLVLGLVGERGGRGVAWGALPSTATLMTSGNGAVGSLVGQELKQTFVIGESRIS